MKYFIRGLALLQKIFFLSFISLKNNAFKISRLAIVLNTLKLCILIYFYLTYIKIGILRNPNLKVYMEKYSKIWLVIVSIEISFLWTNWLMMIVRRKTIIRTINKAKAFMSEMEKFNFFNETASKAKYFCCFVYCLVNGFYMFLIFYNIFKMTATSKTVLTYFILKMFIYYYVVLFCFAAKFVATCLKILWRQICRGFECQYVIIISCNTTFYQKQKACDQISEELDKTSVKYQKLFELKRDLNHIFNNIILSSLTYLFVMTVSDVSFWVLY